MIKSQNIVMKLMRPRPATMLITVSFKLNFPGTRKVYMSSRPSRTKTKVVFVEVHGMIMIRRG